MVCCQANAAVQNTLLSKARTENALKDRKLEELGLLLQYSKEHARKTEIVLSDTKAELVTQRQHLIDTRAQAEQLKRILV